MLVIVFAALVGELVRGQSQGCYSDCKQLSFNSCNICYDSCQNGAQQEQNDIIQYDLIFKKCTYTCMNTYKMSCRKYQQIDLSQSDCIRICCQEPSYSKFTNETFNQCTSVNDQQKQYIVQFIIIAVSVAVGFPFLLFGLLVAYCYGCLGKIKQCLLCFFKCGRQQLPQENSHPQIQIQDQSNQIISHQSQIEVSLIEKKRIDFFSEICSICLCENINCQTSCGHKFHFECFRLWIERNPSCPNCKNNSFNDLKLYCLLCRKKQANYCLKIDPNKKNQLPKIKIICECTAKKIQIKKHHNSIHPLEDQN